MAVERPVNQRTDLSFISSPGKSRGISLTESIRRAIPNHLLDTKFFHQLSTNDVIQADPSSVYFSGFEPGTVAKQTLRLLNTSAECQRMHIIPPATKYFKVWYTKKDRLVPGLSMDVKVEFTPDEWRYYYDCIRIHCRDTENLIIPVHAYPVMDVSHFPKNYSFSPTPVSQSKTAEIPLKCKAPVDFEFNITFPQPHPAFTVEPIHGVVPANGETLIKVTFSPTDFSTVIMKLQLNISQFNCKPVLSTFTGSSAPGLAKAQVTSKTFVKERTLDPRSISPLNLSRKNRKKDAPKSKTVERGGVRFPNNLDAQHSVNSVLLQQAGKLSVKELQQAMLSKEGSVLHTRQIKEANFDQQVKEDIEGERRNQLRWQVHLGRDEMSPKEKFTIIEERQESVSQYLYRRGDPLPDLELNRPCNSCFHRRTVRKANRTTSKSPRFDFYSNDPWTIRHRAIGHFQQAVNKIILRLRAQQKLPRLRKLVEEFRLDKAGKTVSTTYGDDFELARYSDMPLMVSSERILTHAFPTYTSPDYKDDMAADSLGIVPTKQTPLEVKREVPFFKLKVPHQYQLMGYKTQNVNEGCTGYVPPNLIRPLRTGAQDELINMSIPEQAWVDEKQLVEPNHLVPPSTLFTPTDYPSLHIFNPAPGLEVFLPPMPYAETDPDFHLCPLPQYTHNDVTNKHGSTLKKFLDMEDVIKGVMQWKKFPSQGLVSLAHTPTLMKVWVPRWTDPFDKDLLPGDVPTLLDGLPEEDKNNIREDEGDDCDEVSSILSPAMVNAEFPAIDALTHVDQSHAEKDEFPFGTKLPTHNNPVSSTGPVPRKKREKELEVFLKKRNNRLGEKIQDKLSHLNRLLHNKDLVLQ